MRMASPVEWECGAEWPANAAGSMAEPCRGSVIKDIIAFFWAQTLDDGGPLADSRRADRSNSMGTGAFDADRQLFAFFFHEESVLFAIVRIHVVDEPKRSEFGFMFVVEREWQGEVGVFFYTTTPFFDVDRVHVCFLIHRFF
jgi:hypothetical protein